MISHNNYSPYNSDYLNRNKKLFEQNDFQAAINGKISKPVDGSIIPFLRDFGLSTDDAFILVDSLLRPSFKLWKVPAYPGFLRVYLFQAMTADFGLSDDLRNEYYKLNKKIYELSIEEVRNLLKYSALIPDDDSDMFFYYFFNQHNIEIELLGIETEGLANYVRSFEENNFNFVLSGYGSVDDDTDKSEDEKYPFHYGHFPPLFTNIMAVSHDQGGMLIMELFGTQIYELYTANGHFIA